MADREERNWTVFITKHMRDWHGLWTRYKPDGEVSQNFQSLRSFANVDDAKTQVHQENHWIYSDGKVDKRTWDFSRSENSFSDGLVYPGASNYRVTFFESGELVLRPIHLKDKNKVEMFFLHDNLRVSTVVMYDSGNLTRVACIREDYLDFPGQYWSKDVEKVPERSFEGNWEGTSTTMHPDLTVSKPVATKHQWGCWEGHRIYYLPDGVTVSCPLTVPEGRDLVIVANWQANDKEMYQMSVLYNEAGEFVSKTLDVLHLTD